MPFNRAMEALDSVGTNFLTASISDSHSNEWKCPWALWIPYDIDFGYHSLKRGVRLFH